jgi:hypothetical protein
MQTPAEEPRATAPGYEPAEANRPFWPVAAAFLAGGIGVFAIGLITTLAEASESLKDWLQLSDPVGPLSGKTLVAAAAFVVSWPILHLVLRGRDVSERVVFTVTAVLVVLGLIGTFPTFFESFAPE